MSGTSSITSILFVVSFLTIVSSSFCRYLVVDLKGSREFSYAIINRIVEANCLAFAKIILANFWRFIHHPRNEQSYLKAAPRYFRRFKCRNRLGLGTM